MGIKALLIGISVFEIGMLYWLLCGTVLEKEYFRKKDWIILYAGIVGSSIDVGENRSFIFFSQYAFIICVVVTCICVTLINGQYRFLRIIVIILYYSSVALMDFFAAFIMECILFLCVRLIVACCVYQIVKRKFDKAYIREFQSLLLAITIIMCFMLRYYQIAIVTMMLEGREQEAGTMGLSLMGAMLITFFTGIVYLKNKALEKEKELLIMRDTVVTQKFAELETVMEKNRQLSHDLKHHMLVLKNYAKEGNCKEVYHYIEEIEEEFFETKKRVWTGNRIADMILEQKRALAEQEGIVFAIQAVPIAEWPFNDNETCSLLGNLLDNAIEACKRADSNIENGYQSK